jgi:hypothetical protein
MIELGVRAGITEPVRTDIGEVAGEEVYGLGSDPGVDSKQYDVHAEVVHLSCIADIVTCAVRKQGSDPWKLAPDLEGWKSGCYLAPDGSHLRRIAFVTSWNDDRHYALCRSWESLGEICFHNLPMQLIVVMLGRHVDGKYHSYWSHGLLHPANKKLRFRKRNRVAEPFKESWQEVWREDHDEISTQAWLQGMLDDDVLRDVCIRVDIPVPKPDVRQKIVDLGKRKLELISGMLKLPDPNLSTCFWPVPCVHWQHCHAGEEPSAVYGFVRITG